MSEDTTVEALITLDFSGTEMEFLTLDEIREFSQNEKSEWVWLEQETRKDGNIGQVWSPFNSLYGQFNQFVQQSQQHQNNENQLTNLANNLRNQTNTASSQGFRLTQSPEAQFVFSLKDSKGPQIAAYALALLNNNNIKLTKPAAYEGAFWAMQYKQGSQETVDAHQKALESVKHGWAVRFGKQHKELRKNNDQFIQEITTLKSQFDALVEEIDNTKNQQISEFTDTLEEIKGKLADIEHTYDEKLALQSSVQYWSDKRIHHEKVMWWLAGATALFAAWTGGGFIWAAYELLKETVTQMPLWKLGVMLAISSFGVWLTRLSAKIFISNLHLRTDADERITMIQTYLALLREGS